MTILIWTYGWFLKYHRSPKKDQQITRTLVMIYVVGMGDFI